MEETLKAAKQLKKKKKFNRDSAVTLKPRNKKPGLGF